MERYPSSAAAGEKSGAYFPSCREEKLRRDSVYMELGGGRGKEEEEEGVKVRSAQRNRWQAQSFLW